MNSGRRVMGTIFTFALAALLGPQLGLHATGLEGLPALPLLVAVGTVSTLTAAAVLLALEPLARDYTRAMLRRLRPGVPPRPAPSFAAGRD